MSSGMKLKSVMESSRWRQFLESTAAALQINLVFLVPGTEDSISVCETCPVCHKVLLTLSSSDKLSALRASTKNILGEGLVCDGNNLFESYLLQYDFLVIARDYCCCNTDSILSFHERVSISKELLNNFLIVFMEHWDDGQLNTEFSTLRQINHIVLSMFRGDNKALERALDLILSAAIILFDAEGSWIQYNRGDHQNLISKGNGKISSDASNTVTEEVNSPVIQGVLGIIAPKDRERAASFLRFMAQQCVIVFEIDHIMALMESKLTLVLGAIDNMVLLIDRRMDICYANKFAEELLGRSTPELLGLPIEDIATPWNDCIFYRTCKVTKGIKDSFNSMLGERFVDWGVYPLTGSDDIPGWLVLADDCTEFYRLQEIGERAERMVNTANLLSVLAHELRNPLQAFRGMLQIMRYAEEPADISKYIDAGVKEVDRVTRLLNDFLLMGKPIDAAVEPIDLKNFLENMMPLLYGERNNAPIEVETNFATVPPVQADQRQLTQVMTNLVRNAFEAIELPGRVSISLQQSKKGWVEIVVHDTGLGIADEIKDKLFEPFHTTKKDGTGLGLAISQSIIHNHGGEILAQNHPEGGACFSVLLPTKANSSKEIDKIDVLLVTNDKNLRLPVEHVLRAENLNVVTVNNIDKALFVLNRHSSSILIVENAMISPKEYANIKKRFSAVKVLIMGGELNHSDFKDAYFIPKPLNYAKITSTIKSLQV